MIAILSRKGGAGKSTLAVNLAVARSRDNPNVVIIDSDPQESVTKWSERRDHDTPTVVFQPYDEEDWPEELKRMEVLGADWLIVDTPPHAEDARPIAARADLVLVPCDPGMFSLEAILDTVEQAEGRPTWVVMNRLSSLQEADVAVDALVELGVRVAPVRWSERVDMRKSIIDGETPLEQAPRSKAAHQVKSLYKWVCGMLPNPS